MKSPKVLFMVFGFLSMALLFSFASLINAADKDKSDASAQTPASGSSPAASAEPAGSFSAVNTEAATQSATATESAPSAPEVEPTPISLGINEKVSLDLRNIDVNDALRFIAQKGALNMAISKSVTGRVQLLLNNVPVKDILDLILITNGLAYDKVGDVYNIMTETEYKDRYGRKFSDARQVRFFKLKYAIPEQAFALFEALKSEIGRLLVDPESGTVLVMDAPVNIGRMEQALAALEQKKSIKVYSLRYAKAADVETRLKGRLDSKKAGTITADERTNQVIVETLPDRMKEIDEMIRSLDQKTKEVLIDAKIISVTLDNTDTREIKWEGIFTKAGIYGSHFIGNHGLNNLARSGTSFSDDFISITPTTRPSPGVKNYFTENLTFGFLDQNDGFEGLLNFLKTIGETKILSNPRISAVNNQEAKIHVGTKDAYVTSTTTSSGSGTSTVSEAVTFIDVGIQLSVTPTINEDGFVTMKVKPEISSAPEANRLQTAQGNSIPIVDSSLVETTVMVKDGVTIVMGGLRKDEKSETVHKVPFLGDLPVIGLPFNSKTTTVNHVELLIILTPHIIYGDAIDMGSHKGGEIPILSYSDYVTKAAAAKL